MENKITHKGKEDMKKHTVTCHSCNSRHNKKPMIITKQNSLPAQAPHERYLVNNLSLLKSPIQVPDTYSIEETTLIGSLVRQMKIFVF